MEGLQIFGQGEDLCKDYKAIRKKLEVNIMQKNKIKLLLRKQLIYSSLLTG